MKEVESLAIVNVIPRKVRIFRVVNDHSAANAVTVLRAEVRVVPEGSCLVGDIELIQEGLVRTNWTLVDTCHSIGVVGPML